MAADLLEAAILREGADTVAAFIGEPVQGAGGVIVPPDDYWPRIRQICDRHEVLLDRRRSDHRLRPHRRLVRPVALRHRARHRDVRQGDHQRLLSAGRDRRFRRRIAEAIDGAGGPTAGCTPSPTRPIRSAAPWRWRISTSSSAKGWSSGPANWASGCWPDCKRSTTLPHVGDVRGLGLMAAVELVADQRTKAEFPAEAKAGPRVHAATQERGMFTRLRGDVYNFAPCFVTTPAQIDRMVEILGESIAAALG